MIYKNLKLKGIKLDSQGNVSEACGFIVVKKNFARELGIEGVC